MKRKQDQAPKGQPKVSKEKALFLIDKKLQELQEVLKNATYENRYDEAYTLAYNGTETLLEEFFSRDTAMEFRSDVSSMVMAIGGRTDYAKELADYKDHIQRCIAQLKVYRERIVTFWPDGASQEALDAAGKAAVAVGRLEKIFARFDSFYRQLGHRHGGRPTVEINDEYDVQDLLHALLTIDFDDIRPEEWTPSYAGGSARMDVLLKDEKIAIEVKKTRQGLTDKEVGEQLIIDAAKYHEHADVATLVCFIYDPEFRIKNRKGLITDLEKLSSEHLQVLVRINPK